MPYSITKLDLYPAGNRLANALRTKSKNVPSGRANGKYAVYKKQECTQRVSEWQMRCVRKARSYLAESAFANLLGIK